MRRSRSPLSNLTANHAGGVSHPHQRGVGDRQAEEIQRRINGLAGHGQSAPAQQQMFSPYQGHVYNEQRFAAPGPYYPAQGHPGTPHYEQPPYPYSHASPAYIHPPHYADFPMPEAPAQNYRELDDVRASIDIMAQRLNEMQSASSMARAQPAPTPVSRPDPELANQLAELRSIVSTLSQSQPSRDEFASFKSALDQASALLSDASAQSANPESYAKVVETSHSNLARQILDLQNSLSNNHNSEIYAKTLEASHDDLKAQLQQLEQSFSARTDSTIENVQSINERQSAILEELGQLREALNEQAQDDETPATDMAAVETRLEEITRAIVTLSNSGTGVDQLERIEARISDLSRSITTVSADKQEEPVQPDILEALNARLEAFDLAAQSLNESLGSQLNLVHERLENLAVASAAGGSSIAESDVSPLIARLDALVERNHEQTTFKGSELEGISAQLSELAEMVSSSVEPETAKSSGEIEATLSEIDQKLAFITDNLGASGAVSQSDELAQRLARIEEQVASSRDIGLELASQVAEDAVQKAMAVLPESMSTVFNAAQGNPELEGLTADIKLLQESSTMAGNSALQTFDAVRETLERMVGRLASIESTLNSENRPAVALPHDSAPVPAYEAEPEPVYEAEPEPAYAAEPEPIAQEEASFAPEPLVAEEAVEDEPRRQTASDMVAEYRAVIAQGNTLAPETQKIAGVEALIEEAARAEEERAKIKASSQPDPELRIPTAENEREFKSDPDSAYFVNEAVDLAPHVETAPSLDNLASDTQLPVMPDHVPEVPLEPGSMGPDLAALVRQANERRKSVAKASGESSNNEFIAAARRAAQAAAEEASAVQDEIKEQAQQKSSKLLPSLFARKKKAVMMAAGAALLATIAVPMIGSMMSADAPEHTASLNTPAINSALEESEDATQGAEAAKVRLIEEEADVPVSVASVRQPVVEASLSAPNLENNSLGNASLMAPSPVKDKPVAVAVAAFGDEVGIGNAALKSSVAAGDPAAMFEVGRRYLEGQGTEKNIETAALWLKRAAERDFAPAQYLIGNMTEKGHGVEKNRQEALKWYETAAEKGHVVAMHNLAVLHATPDGATGQPDMAQAFKWFSKAADHGVRDSQVNLGIFYTKGVGTEVNLAQAYRWFTLAAKAGDKDAESKRDVVANALRPDQLESAKNMVIDWRPAEAAQATNNYRPNDAWVADLEQAPISNNKQAVAKAQLMLSKLGFSTGPADGIMGRKTREAIASFQQQSGLRADGEVTIQLLRKLEAVAI